MLKNFGGRVGDAYFKNFEKLDSTRCVQGTYF